jgi:catechol 2,3-dioxygenase-like lactoylglutathione lyase family enzyme
MHDNLERVRRQPGGIEHAVLTVGFTKFMRGVPQMDSMLDSLFDQYERGRMTRRHLVQALAALVVPTNALAQGAGRSPAPIVRGLSVNHVALTVTDVPRSFAFYERLFGVTKGWPATDAGTGIHMDLPDGYISIDSVAQQKRVITHFAVAVEHMDRDAAKRLADKINRELPDAKARDAYQANTGGSTVNLRDPDGFFVQISSKDGR